VDHVRPRSTMDRGCAAESAVACLPECGAQALWLAGGCREGQRRERGRGGAEGALTDDGAVVKRPGDGGKAAGMKTRAGGELRCERGGKEGGVGCSEMRCGRGAFFRCQGGGRRPDGGGRNSRWRWSAKMVVEAAISGGDQPRSDEGELCSGRFRSRRGRGDERRQRVQEQRRRHRGRASGGGQGSRGVGGRKRAG
jgi:hypothetical protein